MCKFYTDTSGETFIIFKRKKTYALIGKGSQSIVVHALSLKTLKRIAYYRTFLNNQTARILYQDEQAAVSSIGRTNGLISLHSTQTYTRKELKRISLASYYPYGDLLNAAINKKLTLENKRSIMKALIEIVKTLHDHNVVHRDIKLDNILLKDFNTPLLADVGYMTVCSAKSHTFGFSCGSPHYIAPELHFKSISGLTNDVWSLGVTLYALFKESMPYGDHSHMKQAGSKLDLSDPYEKAIASMLTYDHLSRPSLDQIQTSLKKAII